MKKNLYTLLGISFLKNVFLCILGITGSSTGKENSQNEICDIIPDIVTISKKAELKVLIKIYYDVLHLSAKDPAYCDEYKLLAFEAINKISASDMNTSIDWYRKAIPNIKKSIILNGASNGDSENGAIKRIVLDGSGTSIDMENQD